MANLSRVVAAVEIDNVRLCEGSCRSLVRPSESVEDVAVKVSYAPAVTETRESELLVITVSFSLDVHDRTDKENLQAEIRGTFELSYRLPADEGFSAEELKEFGRVNAVFNAWPYWREYVQASLARMSLPALTMPVFRILPSDSSESRVEAME